jgi:hypothetical protein
MNPNVGSYLAVALFEKKKIICLTGLVLYAYFG